MSGEIRVNWRQISLLVFIASIGVVTAGILREVFLFLFGAQTRFSDLRFFNLNAERTLGAWYTSSLLLMCALLLLVAALDVRRHRARHQALWFLLAVGFLFLSFDESAEFHETLNFLVPAEYRTGPFLFAWVIFGAAGVGLLGLVYFRFLADLNPRTRLFFLLSGGIYVAGAVVMEMVGGEIATGLGQSHLLYIAAYCIEEGLEIAGVSLFLAALLDYLARRPGPLTLRF